ncbi:helix-turn-helix transcriptional regulator [Chitinophaga sp. MM2321]|uniref:helix-turn-helix domain-containing protein n=1 Tax=Chitinophaga sp. MM2321 TaxID=3137178 RepID=UPI0032D57F60
MTKNNEARKYSSKIIADLLAGITPLEDLQIGTKILLADRIGKIMDDRGLNNKDLAAKMSKSPSEISRWLSGGHNFTIDTLSEIAIALEVPIEQFFIPTQVKVVRDIRLSLTIKDVKSNAPYFSPVVSNY